MNVTHQMFTMTLGDLKINVFQIFLGKAKELRVCKDII